MVELKKNIVLIGGGGHCMSVIDIIENGTDFNILGVLDSNARENYILGYKILGDDNLIPELVNENTCFLIGSGLVLLETWFLYVGKWSGWLRNGREFV